MKSALLDEHDGLRTFVVVFETGDEAADGLAAFAREQHPRGSHFTAIGAFSRVVVAYFDKTQGIRRTQSGRSRTR